MPVTSPTSTTLPPDLAPTLIAMVNANLGNTCVALPVLDRLTRHFAPPSDVLVDHRYADLVATALPGRRILPAPASGPACAALGLRLAARRYRAVIDVGGVGRSSALTAMTMAPRRIGLDSSRRRRSYTQCIATCGAVHTLDRYARMLGLTGAAGRPPRLAVGAGSLQRAAVRRALAERFGDRSGPVVVMHCGAGKTYRLWPQERFAAVADDLAEARDARVCIVGVPSELELMQRVRDHMARPNDACLLHLPLMQLLALMESASLMLGNESGPMHLAALTDVPIVAIYGPTDEARWSPVRTTGVVTLRGAPCDPACHRSSCAVEFRCLRELTVDQVVSAAVAVLAPDREAAVAMPRTSSP